MSINLKTFRQITNGFARNHHFNIGIIDWRDLAITDPTIGKIVGTLATPMLSLFCSSTALPTKSIASERIPIHYGIPGIQVARNVEYSPWRVTFYGDELMLLRFFFLRWMELINNTKNQSYSLPTKYKSTLAYAALLTPQDIPCHVFTFKGLFPIQVSQLILQQQDTSVTTFEVEFSYDFFQVNEPLGFGLALAHEIIGESVLRAATTGNFKLKPRKINAPFGITVPLPF